jgi:hypothetical protein
MSLAPGEVRECAVSFSHLVGIFTLLNSGTLTVVSISQLGGDAVSHAHTLAGARSLDKPHGRQVVLALAADFEWNLVVRTTDTSGASLDMRLDILESLLKDFEWVLYLEPGSSLLHTFVYEALSKLLLTI